MSQIDVQNLNVFFTHKQQKIQAVKDVSFSVQSGEIFGIVGLSGAGKSTLIRTLNLLQKLHSGTISIDGQTIIHSKGNELKQVRRKIGMIFQQFNLIQNRTVGQNINFALKAGNYPKEKREKRIQELLTLVDLLDKKDHYPSTLSGGQKQRIGIARALANSPEILLYDEATSALDIETTEEILQILEKINRDLGLTIIFITHELEVAKRLFHRMAVMKSGEIIEQGDTFTLFSNPQKDTTKKLVSRFFDLKLPIELQETLTDGPLLELRYQGEHTLDPLISSLSKKYNLSISITHGKIEYIKKQAIGILYIYLLGETKQIQLAIKEIKTTVFRVRLINQGGHFYGIND